MRHYDECYFINYDSYDDLCLYEVGCQKCPSNYSFGPIIRTNYVLHYVLEGKGTLYLDNTPYSIHEKQAFLIPPNVVAFNQADEKEPWNYIWIHFNGTKVTEFLHIINMTKDNPVYIPQDSYTDIEHCMQKLLSGHSQEILCIGLIYELFHHMTLHSPHRMQEIVHDNQELKYIKMVIDYISHKYSEPIHITDIAEYCCLDRSYLSKIFKTATNYSPQEYLIRYRLKKAKQLLKDADIPIQHVAYAVGYNDPFSFSKIFKKELGITPSEYRTSKKANSISE